MKRKSRICITCRMKPSVQGTEVCDSCTVAVKETVNEAKENSCGISEEAKLVANILVWPFNIFD